jgi:hypothetical protein
MAASAEYELEKRVEKMELIEVDLDKGNRYRHSYIHRVLCYGDL